MGAGATDLWGLQDMPADWPVLVWPGTAQIDQDLYAHIAQAGIMLVWVQGDLDARFQFSYYGRFPKFCVSGDMRTPSLDAWTGFGPLEPVQVLGTIHCRHYFYYAAEDDGDTRLPKLGRVHTPLAFLWYVQCAAPLALDHETVVFLFGDADVCHAQANTLRHPTLVWHECIHALGDTFYGVPEADWHNTVEWNTDAIAQALARGESIWREGFAPQTLLPWRKGHLLAKAGDVAAAWTAYGEALKAAPGFGLVAGAMGRLLYRRGALRQALPFLQQAQALFPQRQTGIADDSVGFLALCLLYLGQAQAGRNVAEAEIHRLENDDAKLGARRALLEIALVQGDLATAQSLLAVMQPGNLTYFNTTLWLRGLWHWKTAQQGGPDAAGNRREAERLRADVASRSPALDLDYAVHGNLRALLPRDCVVDWPGA